MDGRFAYEQAERTSVPASLTGREPSRQTHLGERGLTGASRILRVAAAELRKTASLGRGTGRDGSSRSLLGIYLNFGSVVTRRE